MQKTWKVIETVIKLFQKSKAQEHKVSLLNSTTCWKNKKANNKTNNDTKPSQILQKTDEETHFTRPELLLYKAREQH